MFGHAACRDCHRRSSPPVRCSGRTTSPTSAASCTSASTAADPVTATPTTRAASTTASATARRNSSSTSRRGPGPTRSPPCPATPIRTPAGYSIVAEPSSGTLYVGDPNSGQILNITTDGTVTRVADLSDPHMVPTRLALDPDGGVYVGTLTPAPFTDGAAQVWHVDTDGTATVVWTGLTAVVDVA